MPSADTLTSLHIESDKILSLEIKKALKDLKLKLPGLLSLSLGSLNIPSHVSPFFSRHFFLLLK